VLFCVLLLASVAGGAMPQPIVGGAPAHLSNPLIAAAGRTGFSALDYITWGAYLVGILIVGLCFTGRDKGTSEFFLGGRRIPWWAAGISIFGTQLSAITFMAIPAKVYATDWVYMPAQAGIVIVAPVIVYFYLPFFRRRNITTAYEYLEQRFGYPLRVFAAGVFCLMQLGRMAIVLFLPALALSTAAHLNIYLCILIMGILCTIYTALGGIEAVIWTDVVQVFVLMGGAVLCVVIIASRIAGGVPAIVEMGMAADKFRMARFTWDYTTTAVWVVLVGNALACLVPYSADQTVVQRYLTTATEKQAAKAIWTNAALTLPSSLIFFFLGTALYAFYQTLPDRLNANLSTDAILPWFIVRELPSGVAGIILAAIFAASMSSLDSSLNSMATVVMTDFYSRVRPDTADSRRLALARAITVGLGLFATACALLMACYPIQSLWDLFLTLVGLLGGPLAGVFALGMFTRRANAAGAVAGLALGAVVVFCVHQFTQVHFFLYAGIGIAVCLSAGYAVSVLFSAGSAARLP